MTSLSGNSTRTDTQVYTGGASSATASPENVGGSAISPSTSGASVTGKKNTSIQNESFNWSHSFNDLTNSADSVSNSTVNWGDNSVIVSDWGIYNLVGNATSGSATTDTTVTDSTTGSITPSASADTSDKQDKETSAGGVFDKKTILIIAAIAAFVFIYKEK